MDPTVNKIVVVFKSHFDYGFTALPEQVIETYTRVMIPRALEVWEQTAERGKGKGFVWTLPAWVLRTALDRLDGTAVGKRLERAVELGGVVWHALPFTTHTESLTAEAVIRGLWYGRNLSERFGRRCISAKMTDVPGHAHVLPSLLAGAGIRFLHLGSNSCSTPPDVPPLFRWEGPDGKSVITMYSKGGYGSSLLPPAGWPMPVWLALEHTMDNEGPQDRDVVMSILNQVNHGAPHAEVITGSLDDFAEELLPYEQVLPIVRGDLADSWIHGLGSMPSEVSCFRATMNRLPATESLWALGCRRESGEVAKAIDEAYEQLLLFGEHTFGLDTKIALNPPEYGGRVYGKQEFNEMFSKGRYSRIIESWDRKAGYSARAQSANRKAIRALLSLPHDQANGGLDEEPPRILHLYNSHLWVYDGLVDITDRLPSGVAASYSIRNSETGQPVPCFSDGKRWFARVHGVPPLGELAIEVATKRVSVSRKNPADSRQHAGKSGTIANEFVELRFDEKSGELTHFIDRATGKNWVDDDAGERFCGYRYDIYGKREIGDYLDAYAFNLSEWYMADFGKPDYPEIDHRKYEPSIESVSIRREAEFQEVVCRFKNPEEAHSVYGDASRMSLTAVIYDACAWVDFEYRLEAKEATPFLESGHVVFPLAAADPRYAVSKIGGVIDPTTDIPENANRVLVCCEDWVDVSDGREGLLFTPIDSPLFSIGRIGICRFDGTYRPSRPVLYFNLYNNQWGTNFPQWIAGSLRYRFRVMPHHGDWQSSGVWRASRNVLRPPIARPMAEGARHAGDPRRTCRLLRRALSDLDLLSLHPVDGNATGHRSGDGYTLALRLRELSGKSGERMIDFARGVVRVDHLDLMERNPRAITLEPQPGGSRIRLHFEPFEIQTLRIEIISPCC